MAFDQEPMPSRYIPMCIIGPAELTLEHGWKREERLQRDSFGSQRPGIGILPGSEITMTPEEMKEAALLGIDFFDILRLPNALLDAGSEIEKWSRPVSITGWRRYEPWRIWACGLPGSLHRFPSNYSSLF